MFIPRFELLDFRWIYQEGAIVSGSSGTSPSSSYSLKEIVLERDPIPVIDLSDSETVEGPVGEAAGQQISELREEISRVDALFCVARQAAARAAMLETELVKVQEVYAARKIEIQELVDGFGSLSSSSLVLLGIQWIELASSWSPDQELLVADTLRRSRPRIGNMSDLRSSNHADGAVSENSQSRQPELISENTPHPEQAMYTVMENFMIRMTELLETSMAIRRHERWLRASQAQALKNQPWTWTDFQEELKMEYIPRWVRHVRDQCPEMHQDPPEMSRRTGRPPAMKGATEERSDKPQVKAKVYTLDGLPVDTEAEVVEGDFLRAYDNSGRSISRSSKDRAVIDWTQPKIPVERQRIELYMASPRTKASSDGVDDLDSGEWIYLKRDVVLWKAWPNWCTWTQHHALRWDGKLVESKAGLETMVGPRKDLISGFDSDDLVVGSGHCPGNPIVALIVSLHSVVELR
ncbi:hypothetical protein M9H77_12566 [Catharanthus roseus]|uniref:Uncharacterized protein n=1 Tax=Catharanthus roseus TaxID=4058 RepID=A0ACC0BHT0_CATRO|nr:hypothetical protein M9H77_12566 [Catharanthus roseus]